MKKIKNVIFDFGNVLFTVDTGAHIRFLESLRKEPTAHGEDSSELRDLINKFGSGVIPESLFFAAWEKLEFGKIPIKDLKKAWLQILGEPIYEQEEAIRKLLGKDIRIALLSNTDPVHVREFEKPAFPILRHFKKRYYSHEIGYLKPQLHAYAYVLKDCDFDPRETLMIDDLPKNIDAVAELGMHGLCLLQPEKLERELTEMGVL